MAQMENLLLSSGISIRFWLTYLKQQFQKDSRAFDVLIAAEKEHSHILKLLTQNMNIIVKPV